MDNKVEAMFQHPDDLDFCEACGKPGCEVVEMGRKWCHPCWEAFKVEYNAWLNSTCKEDSDGK